MILLTIFLIVSALFVQNGLRDHVGGDFSWAVPPILGTNGLRPSHQLPWLGGTAPRHCSTSHGGHMLCLILAFMNYLPFSKHLHVLTSIPNVFFGPLQPSNKLEPIDFEAEGAESFGVVDMEDFTWKTLLDGYTCTHCGRCTSVCPANQTGKVLDPRAVIVGIHERTMDKAPLVEKKQRRGRTYRSRAGCLGQEACWRLRFAGCVVGLHYVWCLHAGMPGQH